MRNLGLTCLLGLGLMTGCSTRHILSVQDGGGDNASRTTIIKTRDVDNFVIFSKTKIVHWECADQGSQGLSCSQTCDVKDDEGDLLVCPTAFGGGSL